jgi:hypothetical protein
LALGIGGSRAFPVRLHPTFRGGNAAQAGLVARPPFLPPLGAPFSWLHFYSKDLQK